MSNLLRVVLRVPCLLLLGWWSLPCPDLLAQAPGDSIRFRTASSEWQYGRVTETQAASFTLLSSCPETGGTVETVPVTDANGRVIGTRQVPRATTLECNAEGPMTVPLVNVRRLDRWTRRDPVLFILGTAAGAVGGVGISYLIANEQERQARNWGAWVGWGAAGGAALGGVILAIQPGEWKVVLRR